MSTCCLFKKVPRQIIDFLYFFPRILLWKQFFPNATKIRNWLLDNFSDCRRVNQYRQTDIAGFRQSLRDGMKYDRSIQGFTHLDNGRNAC